MFITCKSKGCYKESEALLDPNDGPSGTVYCAECGNSVDVPNSTKTILKTLGQVKRQIKSGLVINCERCNTKDKPLLHGKGKEERAVCRNCKEPLKISGYWMQAIKEMRSEYKEEDSDQSNLRAEES